MLTSPTVVSTARTTPQGARGVLLIAHGSRDPSWAAPFERLRNCMDARDITVELAYLEQMSPDLAAAACKLAARGCADAVVVPLFLGQGGHVRDDLPRLVADAMRAYPSLKLRLATPIGEDARVLDAIADVCIAEQGRSSP